MIVKILVAELMRKQAEMEPRYHDGKKTSCEKNKKSKYNKIECKRNE